MQLLYQQILEEPNWPDSWPFSPADFQRYDESKDTAFYDAPRFVTHIDDGAISALTRCTLLTQNSQLLIQYLGC